MVRQLPVSAVPAGRTKTAGMSRGRDIAGYDRNARHRKRALHGALFPVTVRWILSSSPARESRRREFRASAGLPFHPAAVGPPPTAGYWCKPAPLPLQRGKNIQTRIFVKKKVRDVTDRRVRTTEGCEPHHIARMVSAPRPFFRQRSSRREMFPARTAESSGPDMPEALTFARSVRIYDARSGVG